MRTLIQKMKCVCEEKGDKLAVNDLKGGYTYEELWEKVSIVSNVVLAFKKQSETFRVAILLPRTKEYILAIYAVLKAGCTYIPLDSSFPMEQIESILEDSGCNTLIIEHSAQKKFENSEGLNLLDLDDLLSNENADKTDIDCSDNSKEGVILYTSGSTGKPKGVVHRANIMRTISIDKFQTAFTMTENDNVCFATNFTFIGSIVSLSVANMKGAHTYVMSEEEVSNLKCYEDIIRREKVTYMFIPPKLLNVLLDNMNLPLKYVFTASEKVVSIPHTDAIIVEGYGASEIAPITCHELREEKDLETIGSECFGKRVYLVDKENNFISQSGIIGELCVASEDLALEYLNRPEESKKKFVYNEQLGKIIYHTGDLAEKNENGEYVFHGRMDHMVKLNGFRIELGEPESMVRKIKCVKDSACAIKKVNGIEKLVCYYTTYGKDEEISDEDIENLTKYSRTSYLVPGLFMKLESMPLNRNSKLDRFALPEPKVTTRCILPCDEKEEIFLKEAKKILKDLEFGVTDNLLELGLDSLGAMKLSASLKDKGMNYSASDFFKYKRIRNIIKGSRNIIWYVKDYDDRKETVVFIAALVALRQVLPVLEGLSDYYNILLIEPIYEHFNGDLDRYQFDGMVTHFMNIIEECIHEGEKITGYLGFSYGGEISAALAAEYKRRTGIETTVIMGDTWPKEKEEFRDRPLTEQDFNPVMFETLDPETKVQFIKNLNMMNSFGYVGNKGFYDGKIIYLDAQAGYSEQEVKNKIQRICDRYKNLSINSYKDMAHPDFFSGPKAQNMISVYAGFLGGEDDE